MKEDNHMMVGIFIGFICGCIVTGSIAGLTITWGTSDFDSQISDDYQTMSFHKDYKILRLREHLEEGRQYDYICVDWYHPWNDTDFLLDDAYGFLRVNETTNKIEFIEWRVSNNFCVVSFDSNYTDGFDIILRSRRNQSHWP